MRSSLIVDEEGHSSLSEACGQLVQSTDSRCVFLVDRNGLLITSSGDADHVDGVALASLTAGNMAATNGIANLIGESEFGAVFHQGAKDSIHISLIGERMILVIIFAENSSLGLVKLRVDQARPHFEGLLQAMTERGETRSSSLGHGITTEDIDNLLGNT